MSLQDIPFDILKKAIEEGDFEEALKLLSEFNFDYLDGVTLEDVKELVHSKEDLENILFSTKIIVKSKDDVVEFLNLLMKYGYKDSAIEYFERLVSNLDEDTISKIDFLK